MKTKWAGIWDMPHSSLLGPFRGPSPKGVNLGLNCYKIAISSNKSIRNESAVRDRQTLRSETLLGGGG